MSTVAAKARIRQNPPVAAGKAPTAACPTHGVYEPPAQASQLQRLATGPNVDPDRARTLMDQAARMRRNCPDCGGRCPTPLEWATAVRTLALTPTVFRMPTRALADPEACQ
ncbi:hypothetical protein AB0C47_34740 [Micromonospora taraxaci]|uniref:hypothetical protein n=1 Tax=Micromonospora taraxaci TaxID=1316803 RepID=UPI0033CB3B93